RAAHGDDEGRHHRLGMAGLEPVQRPQGNRAGDEQPGVAVLQEGSEIGHAQRYLLIALNSRIVSRGLAPGRLAMGSRQWSIWSCTSVFFAFVIALSTACNCCATSRHSRPSSSIATMLRRWPSARFRRLTISGWRAWADMVVSCGGG